MCFNDFQNSIKFVILSPEYNFIRLKDTFRSINNHFSSDAKIICSVAKGVKKDQLEEMKTLCPSFRGGNTIMSLINNGMKKTEKGWIFFIMEGARFPSGLIKRYSTWLKSDRDVLFPIFMNHNLNGKPSLILTNFSETTLNGTLIHSNLFSEVGEFSDNPIKISKEFWMMDALEKNANFKAILGIKII